MKSTNGMKGMYGFFCGLLLFVCSPHKTFAQRWECQKSISVPMVGQVSLDRYNYIYVADTKGLVYKYDEEGKFQVLYSPPKFADVALLEAWNTIKLFIFYREFQEYVILERFLTPKNNMEIDQNAVGFARLATLASDFNLWLFDDVDFTLKKYDQQYDKVLFSSPLSLILKPKEYDIRFMREYQNMLYISDYNSGILVFDLFGNFKKRIPLEKISSFGFVNDQLYYLYEDKIRFFDLYNFSEKTWNLPKDKAYAQALVTPKYTYLFHKDGFDICTYTP